MVAIQIGAVSFMDEGVAPVLDTLEERGGVNALFLATPTWTRGTGGRQIPGYPLPDHGAQEYDLNWVGGNFATVHPEYYGKTILGPVGRAPEHPDIDIFETVLPEAQRRGMKTYAWMEESSYALELRRYPNFLKCLEVDIWNKPARRPCFNNPDYRNWHLSIVEDYIKSYNIDGIAWCSERPGPLNLLIQGPIPHDRGLISCFCRYCREIARDRGIDWHRAQLGFREAVAWSAALARGERPADGAFVSFWRLLLRYPELLAWQQLWTDSQHQIYRDIYGTVKAYRPEVQVGWHIYHDISFSPFYRAAQSYSDLSHFSDFIKVVTYNNCAGPRFHTWIDNICQSLFADASPAEVYPLMLRLLGLDENPYEELPFRGFSAEYVRRETARAVAQTEGRCQIYPGIDIDIPLVVYTEFDDDVPVGQPGGPKQPPAGSDQASGSNTDTHSGPELTGCSPGQVRDAVHAAFAGGAQGVVLSRKYSEMRLDNLAGAGAALKELS